VAGVPTRDAVLASTSSGLFAFTLRGDAAEGRQILRDPASTLRAIGGDEVVVGSSELLRRLRLSGMGTQVEAAEEARAEAVGVISDMAFSSFAGVLWTLADNRLVARTPSQLQEVGSLQLPVAGRTLSLSGGRGVITAGSQGLLVVDVSRPEAPRLLGRLEDTGFVFDAVLEGDRAYVAAGQAGLLVVDISDAATPRTVGVGRRLGYVTAVAPAGGGKLYVLDRNGPRLHTVDPGAVQGSR
jgi:hypothetical protein